MVGTKPDRAKSPKKRAFFGEKKKGRPGRPPKPNPAEMDSIALARTLGRSALGEAVLRYTHALNAVKPVYMKADDGEGGSAYIPGEDIPDHAIRIRAADALCDRFGIPKKAEVTADDPTAILLAALAAAAKERTERA